MAQSIKSFYAIALIANFAVLACAITCQICNSHNEFKCSDSLYDSSEFLSDCYWPPAPSYLSDGNDDLPATGCMVKKVELWKNGESEIIRSCYWGNISDTQTGCRNSPFSRYTTLLCYVCDSHACNSGIKFNSEEGYDMSSSCNIEPIAVVIALFFAITRWMS